MTASAALDETAPAAGRDRFLARLSPDDRDAVQRLGRSQQYPHQACLFRQGDASDFVVLVLDGVVKVSVTTPAGRELVMAIRGPGDLVGELAAIDGAGRERAHTAASLEPVNARVIGAAEFGTFIETRPAAMHALLRTMCHRLRDADRQRVALGQRSTVVRLVDRLCELADEFGEPGPDGTRIDLALSQDELASWIGASREALVRALSSLRARGMIDTQRRSITVRDLAALSREPLGE